MNTGWQGAAAPENSGTAIGNSGTGMPAAGSDRALGGQLVTLMREGVESGDADRGLPEEIGRLVDAGAGVDELLAALKQAAERGRISPLLLVKAEKLLDAGPGADEPVDRSQVLSRNRNKLTF
jgi:hypothetical protein